MNMVQSGTTATEAGNLMHSGWWKHGHIQQLPGKQEWSGIVLEALANALIIS